LNFDFSPEQKEIGTQLRRLIADVGPPAAVRRVLDGEETYSRALWQKMGEAGFLGTRIPEQFGGAGAGYLELCVVAEELGRAVAAVPMLSSIYLAAELLLHVGSAAQKAKYLPKLATGEWIGTLAMAEGIGQTWPSKITAAATATSVTGTKMPVLDGGIADFAIVMARSGSAGERGLSLYLVDLHDEGVVRTPLQTLDPTRAQVQIDFRDVPAELLGKAGEGWDVVRAVFDCAAILTAFEQLGGAESAMLMARDYALERMAFGRQIGSFQAIKHLLANMYVENVIARSNCYYGAWALSSGSAELPVAAATARISVTQAYQFCAKENIEVHGSMGFTWAFDCHLHYRRSNLLALAVGSPSMWEDRLIDGLCARNTAAA
jgi:alkylation response protein AidB-like acyl-CoA dehydrogenase